MEVVYSESPEIIICDLVMPKMDGKEFLTRLRADARTREIPVLIFTGQDEESTEIDLLNLGARDFVSKSRSRKVLMSRVHRLMRP